MKNINSISEVELLESIRLAGEAALADVRLRSEDRLAQAIVANVELYRRNLDRGVSLTALCKHVEAIGVKCTTDCMRSALVKSGLLPAKRQARKPRNQSPPALVVGAAPSAA